MGRGANAIQSSGILYGSPFQSRPRRIAHPLADPADVLKVRADEVIEKLLAELEADPIDPKMDPINIRMNEGCRAMEVGILKVLAEDPEAFVPPFELKQRARTEHGTPGMDPNATNFGLTRLMDGGRVEHIPGRGVRMVLDWS